MATTFRTTKNRAKSTLAASITDAALTLTLASGDGALFPTTYPFYVTIDDEIVQVTDNTTDVLTIVRAAESTSAAAHLYGAAVRLHITAGMIDAIVTAINVLEVFTERGSLIYRNATVPAELKHGTANQVLVSGGHNADPSWGITPATGVAAQKVNYTTTDLDTEAEIIAAINTTNAAINTIRAALNSLGFTTTV